jgi:hypothetical protein
MPLILSFTMCTICGTAALAMQAARRWSAALVAAILIAISPLATFGTLIQFMPQVWGLGLAAALFALLMRSELHRDSGATLGDIVPIGILVAAVVVVYVELASTLVLAYVIYVGVLAVRRELDLRAAARVWVPAVAFTAIVLNEYLVRELRYVESQVGLGVHGLFPGPASFGYTLIPSALGGIVGFYALPVAATARFLQEGIVVAGVMLAAVFVGALISARRGAAASIVLLAYTVIGVYLGVQGGDFGLLKLYMYVQPFLAAAIAVWLVGARRRRVLAIVALPLALLVFTEISAQRTYVHQSLNPVALRDASSRGLMPTFRHLLQADSKPIVSVTENPVLVKLEAATSDERPLYFMSEFVFGGRRSKAARVNGWKPRRFEIPGSPLGSDLFWENTHASTVLDSGRCTIVLPAGVESMFNRFTLPEREGQDLVAESCRGARDKLVWTASTLGWGFFGFKARKAVSFYPPEQDPFFKGKTAAGFGRYSLVRVLNPTATIRLELSLTTTNLREPLPPASVVGAERVGLPLVGYGSARVYSRPLKVQMVDGEAYLLLDLGRVGKLAVDSRPGVASLYGRAVPIDPRFLTASVRDVSLVSGSQYRDLKRPSVISGFPQALEAPGLEYSGIDETGVVGKDSYVVLAGGRAADLVLRAGVFPAPAGQTLRVLVNGKVVASRGVEPGDIDIRAPVAASSAPRLVELRWTFAPSLPAPDGRKAAAAITYVGFVARG